MPKTVLIVEDNELNMKLFHDLLEAHGYQTVGTRNGIEALDLAREHRPDLITLDILMPGMDGWAVLAGLKADPDLAAACMGDRRYPDLAIEAIRLMIETRGFLEPFDPEGGRPAREGVLVRHLVLPDEEENSLAALRRLREEFGRWLPLSVMSQFRPMPACGAQGRFTRPVNRESYARICDEVVALGVPKRKRQIADLLIETQQEMRKVAWSTRAEVIGSTFVVIVTVTLLSLFIYATDRVLLTLASIFGVY